MARKPSDQYIEKLQQAFTYLVSLKESSPGEMLKEKIAELRAYLLPLDDDDYLTYSYDQILSERGANGSGSRGNTLNPSPYEFFKRSTSGFLSHHHTPHEKFFQSDIILDRQADPQIHAEIQRYMRFRDDRAHRIIQHPSNVAQEALFILNRLVFNIGVKVLTEDDELIVRKTVYPVESLVMESSDGRLQDIVGVWEDLSWFQFRQRFPNPIHDVQGHEQNKRVFELGGAEGESGGSTKDIRVFRFNVPAGVFKSFIESYMYETPEYYKEFKKDLGGKLGKKRTIVDFSVTENGELLEFILRDYRNIIVSHLSFITKDGRRGKGQGDLALSTAATLQEAEEVLMNGFERTYGPAWAFPSELEAKAYSSLGRDDIIYADDTEGIRPLSMQLDLRSAKELILSWEERLRFITYLDTFQLIEKSRMPVQEISMRRHDSFRSLGLLIASDTASNLVPEVTAVMKIDQHVNKIQPLDVGGPASLKVSYISPIIQSIKQSALDSYRGLNQVFTEMAPLMSQPNPITDAVDYGMLVDKILEKTDNTELAVPPEVKQARAEEAARMRQLEIEKQSAEANAANAQALQASAAAEGGEGGEAAPATPGAAVGGGAPGPGGAAPGGV